MTRERLAPLIDLLPLMLGIWLVVQLVSVWAVRATYPFDLEWMEGGMLAHAWRIQQGLPIYTEPGPDWIPFIYPPGYATVLAWAGEVFGLSHTTGRMISLLGTLAAAGAIAFGVTRQTGKVLPGVFGAIAFLGCYPHTGAFYDLVRLDGLYVGLLAWSVVLVLEERRGAIEASGLLLFAAFLFKQNVALFGLPIALALWRRDGLQAAVRYFAWSGGPALAFTGWMHWRTGGIYLKYLLAVPSSHPIVGQRMYPATPRELAWALAIVVVASAIWFLWRAREQADPAWRFPGVIVFLALAGASLDLALAQVKGTPVVSAWLTAPTSGALWAALAGAIGLLAVGRRDLSWRWVLVLGLGVVTVATTMLMRGHHGGFLNVHIQLFWMVCLGGGIAAGQAREHGSAWVAASALLFAGQFALQGAELVQKPLTPSAEDRAHGDHVVSVLSAAEGPVLSPYAPWLAHQAGHEPGFHLISLWDVAHARSPFPGTKGRLRKASAAQHWGAVVTGPKKYAFGVHKHYRQTERLSASRGVFMPKTGWRAQPKALLVPK